MSENKLQILVVEDDELDRMIMKRALNGSGIVHQLHFAEDHESGQEATRGREYDCIFLDYNLPGGTGLELLKAIRASGNSSPIIIVTSQGDEKIAVEAMKNGANDYIPKSLLSAEGIAQSVRYMVNLKKTERERIELQNQLVSTQQHLQAVVSNSPIILFALDQKANFTLFEGKELFELGIEKESFVGMNLKQTTGLPITVESYQRALAGEEITCITEIHEKYFEIFYTPTRDTQQQVNGVIGVASDVTAHKKAEEELKMAKQLAEETARIKEQFLANMSHEIRTPMNGIIGLTRILLESTLSDEQSRYLQSIKICSENLLVIINDILDFSKIEAGKMNFENVPFRLDEIAQHTLELFHTKAAEKSLELINEMDSCVPAQLSGDPTRLNQILNNLVSNAIKFTDSGSVTLRIRCGERTENKVNLEFEVIDTGIGIPENSLHSIFESFTQASSDTTRKFGGTGLGLTIVKKMIELQGGSIGVRSTYGQGTTFYFHLPFEITSDAQLVAETDQDIHEFNTTHLHILIAEDNLINQMIVRKLFKDWETPTEIVENGKLAFDYLQTNPVDIILMDIQMPEMDGYTAARKIREELPEPLRSVPILAMTAHATPGEKQKCFDAGMNDYISKPFEPQELKKKIISITKGKDSSLKQDSPVNTIGEAIPVPQAMDYTFNDLNADSSEERIPPGADPATPNLFIENPPLSKPSEPSGPWKINLSYLKQIADGNAEFVIEMIEMFLNKTPQALEEMQACFEKQNWEELRQIAHRIKPSFGYIGLPDTQKALGEIERLSEQHAAPEQVNQLMNEVQAVSKSAFAQLSQELVSMK